MARPAQLLLASTALAGLSGLTVLAAPITAFAQDDKDQASEVEELVVTGSRIRRDAYTSPDPIQVITSETNTLAGLVDPAEVLQQSTVAKGSNQINNQFSGFVVGGGPGVNTVSLRGLGAQRTLVLLNGRRLNPAGSGGTVAAVDLNILPSAMIDRYEILKDGASSVYGSDAIGGVVNIITRKDLDGIVAQASGTATQDGGGETFDASLTFGRVRDTWNIMGSIEYYEQRELNFGDRDWAACPLDYRIERNPTQPGYGTPVFNRVDINGDPVCFLGDTDYYAGLFSGKVWLLDPSAKHGYHRARLDPTTARPRVRELPQEEGNLDADILSPVKRYSATVVGSADVPQLGGAEFYFEGLLNRRESQQQFGFRQLFASSFADIIPVTFSPFNPIVNQKGNPKDYLQPVLTPFMGEQEQTVDTGRIVLGLRGDFGGSSFLSNWRWDANYIYGKSKAEYSTEDFAADKYFNALDLVVAPAGTDPKLVRTGVAGYAGVPFTCRINVTNPNEKCIPFNYFQTSASLANDPALDYIRIKEFGHTDYDVHDFQAYAEGPLFDLPAGTVSAVIGAEVRHDSLRDVPGPNAIAGNYLSFSSAGITEGSDTVSEGYAEVEAPLLKGLPFIDLLNLNASGRYTHYESSGGQLTYKIGALWQVVPAVKLRATYGTSFRGPALYELYLARQTGFTSAADPCRQYGTGPNSDPTSNVYKNCQSEGLPLNFGGYTSTPEVLSQGALGRLEPETSKNFTAGIVWQPSFINFQIAVDYFNIEVENQIARLGAANILNLCYNSNEFRSGSPYCTLISPRDGIGNIALIDDSYLNISSQKTEGVDVTVRYQREFPLGQLTLDWQGTVTTKDTYELFPGSGDVDFNGTFGDPKFVWNSQARFKHRNWTFFWNMDFTSTTDYYRFTSQNPDTSVYKLWAEQKLIHSASVRYEGDKWAVVGGVRNIFDEDPPVISNNLDYPRLGTAPAAVSQYDVQGRRFFLEFTKEF